MNEASESSGSLRRAWGYLRQAWLVILLGLLYGGALAGVQTTLGPLIAKNKRKETYDRVPQLVAGADQNQTREIRFTAEDGKPQLVYQANAADGSQVGWVLPASDLGFADRIDLLIGLDRDVSTITGLYVLDQKETPGLGDNITSPEKFLDQFAGKSALDPLMVVKSDPAPDSNQIRALSGATISSESVAKIVNEAVQNCREPLRSLSAKTPEAQPASGDPPQEGPD